MQPTSLDLVFLIVNLSLEVKKIFKNSMKFYARSKEESFIGASTNDKLTVSNAKWTILMKFNVLLFVHLSW